MAAAAVGLCSRCSGERDGDNARAAARANRTGPDDQPRVPGDQQPRCPKVGHGLVHPPSRARQDLEGKGGEREGLGKRKQVSSALRRFGLLSPRQSSWEIRPPVHQNNPSLCSPGRGICLQTGRTRLARWARGRRPACCCCWRWAASLPRRPPQQASLPDREAISGCLNLYLNSHQCSYAHNVGELGAGRFYEEFAGFSFTV